MGNWNTGLSPRKGSDYQISWIPYSKESPLVDTLKRTDSGTSPCLSTLKGKFVSSSSPWWRTLPFKDIPGGFPNQGLSLRKRRPPKVIVPELSLKAGGVPDNSARWNPCLSAHLCKYWPSFVYTVVSCGFP